MIPLDIRDGIECQTIFKTYSTEEAYYILSFLK